MVGTMSGVNAELAPWLRMTVPRGLEGFRIEDAPIGRTAFASWVCAFKIPFDRHFLRLEQVEQNRGFREDSHSWLQSRWMHERTLSPEGTGRCRISDRVTFEPRMRFLEPLVERAVLAVFRHRHGELRKRFASKESGTAPLSTNRRTRC